MIALWALAAPARAVDLTDYRRLDPVWLSAHLNDVLTTPDAATAAYWQQKPTLTQAYFYPLHSPATSAEIRAAQSLKEGEFQPVASFPARKMGVPPPWDQNPFNSTTWDAYRHDLEWAVPLGEVYLGKGDVGSLRLMQQIIADWIKHNSVPPGMSPYAWDDHSSAKRLRMMCWFWEIWRKSEAYDPEFAKLLLSSVYQHSLHMANPIKYRPRSNHGLEMDGALLAAVVTFPEFKASNAWRELVTQRLDSYLPTNFSPEGFHLEQSPYYHWFVLERLARIMGFLHANKEPISPAFLDGFNRAASVWPYLVRADGLVPNVGDSGSKIPLDWRQYLKRLSGGPLPPLAASTAPNPRKDNARFVLSFAAGYAIFTGDSPDAQPPTPDTHVLFKCNSFEFTHFHHDALSFTFYGLGRDWLVDSGKLSYEETSPERKYMLSSRAHNVVLIDDQDFAVNPIKLIDWGRTKYGDYVTARHELPQAHHTRTLEVLMPNSMWLTDTLESADEKPHSYSQLFQVAPGLQVKQTSPGTVQLIAPTGDICSLEELSPVGEWHVITGQKEPFLQGWYSPAFTKIEPITTLFFTSLQPSKFCTFSTRISLYRKQELGVNPDTSLARAPEAQVKDTNRQSVAPALTSPLRSSSPLVVFSDPLDQHLSRWNLRATSLLTRRNTGVRCDVTGTEDTSGWQYGGIKFPVEGLKSLKLDLSLLNPAQIMDVYVDGYNQEGRRVLRWQWRLTEKSRPSKRAVYTLKPGRKEGPFKASGAASAATVSEIDVFIAISPGSRAGFVLHRAEALH